MTSTVTNSPAMSSPVMVSSTSSESSHDYCNEQIFERNRLPSRAYFIPEHSILLNGQWRFHYASSPELAPLSTEEISASDTIEVPGHWQLQGYGNPHYTNVQFPFPVDPPFVPSENPTGTYETDFEIPSSWSAGESLTYRLRFDGVDSAFHVSVNGKDVGYSQGSRNAAEFDITHLLVHGEDAVNRVRLNVYQWCDGSYIEDQDQWWLSGIFRDVHVLAYPSRGHIEDFTVQTSLDAEYKDATLDIKLDYHISIPTTIKIVLKGPYSSRHKTQIERCAPLDETLSQARFSLDIEDPQKWTAEIPILYDLTVSLLDRDEVLQTTRQKVGFRQVEIKKGSLLVNGKAILLRGVNRHDHHPDSGRAVPLEYIRKDLILMKQHNINALRCAHYPSHPELYDIADELGLYVVDEADLECHGFYDAVARPQAIPESLPYEERKLMTFPQAAKYTSDNPTWQAAYIERMKQLVHRDKNHPCIIIWSLGNEAFYGQNQKAMYDWVKAEDPTRPVHYEGDVKAASADMFSYMYLPVPKLIENALAEGDEFQKPIILCEYAHAMGNGPGGLREYQDAFHKYRRLQGGFIWEWASHGLTKQLEDGSSFFAYGGDFGDQPNDGNFVMDGLCTSAHEPGPGLLELKKVIQPVDIIKSGDQLGFINRYDFLTLDHLRAEWKLSCFSSDGVDNTLASGILDLPQILPGTTDYVSTPGFTEDILQDDKEYVLTISLKTTTSSAWANAGYEIAWEQFTIKPKANVVESPKALSHPKLNDTRATISLSTTNFAFEFSKASAKISKWSIRGNDVFDASRGPELTFWRAPTDNDTPHDAEMWKLFGVDAMQKQVRSVKYAFDSGTFEITVKSYHSPPILAWGFDATTIYTIHSDGDIQIHVHAVPRGEMPVVIPRFGLEMSLNKTTKTVKWYGRGPGESYKDKKEAARLGIFHQPIDAMHFAYEFPQENGNRTDTGWVQLLDNQGVGVRATLSCKEPTQEDGFDFNVQRFTAHEIAKARHPYELGKSERVLFRIDGGHHGLGTASCGPGAAEKYQLACQTLDFTVNLSAVRR